MNKKLYRPFRQIISLCMALLLSAASFAGAEDAGDPAVVRVGSFTYSLSTVQHSLDSMLDLSAMLRGDAPTAEEKAARVQTVTDSFVDLGILENRLTEKGQGSFTEAEQEQINETARMKYEELWQILYQQMQQSDASVSESAVTEQMDSMGFTMDAILAEYRLQALQDRAISLFVGSIPLTQAQVDDYYDEQFVAPDREAYEGNIARYDREILMNNNESFYTPSGYRALRQIVLAIPEEAREAVREDYVALNRDTRAMSSALQDLTMAAIEADSWEDMREAKAVYTETAESLAESQNRYTASLEAAALPLVQDTVDEIMKQLESGVDFPALIGRYSTDKTDRNMTGEGYPFHPDSEAWPERFIQMANTLAAPGDVSAPFVTEEGIHILYYDSDLPSGAHVLTEEERRMLNAAALRYYQLQALNEQIDGWRADYEIETHPELLTY